MVDEDMGLTWDECIERFQGIIKHGEELKVNSPRIYAQSYGARVNIYESLADLIKIMEQLKDDSDLPNVVLSTSHLSLHIILQENKPVVSVIPIFKGTLYIGLDGYEDVAVPLDKAVATIKHYLTLAQEIEFPHRERKNDVAEELEMLPLEWIAPATLNHILSRAASLAGYKHTLKNVESLPKRTRELIDGFEEIATMILKAKEVSREKRSAKWLAELDKDSDEA